MLDNTRPVFSLCATIRGHSARRAEQAKQARRQLQAWYRKDSIVSQRDYGRCRRERMLGAVVTVYTNRFDTVSLESKWLFRTSTLLNRIVSLAGIAFAMAHGRSKPRQKPQCGLCRRRNQSDLGIVCGGFIKAQTCHLYRRSLRSVRFGDPTRRNRKRLTLTHINDVR